MKWNFESHSQLEIVSTSPVKLGGKLGTTKSTLRFRQLPQNRLQFLPGTPASTCLGPRHPRIDFIIAQGTPESTLSFRGYPRIGAYELVPQNRLCDSRRYPRIDLVNWGTPESIHPLLRLPPNRNYPKFYYIPCISPRVFHKHALVERAKVHRATIPYQTVSS